MDKKHIVNKEDGINMIKLVVYFHTNEGGVQLPNKQAFPKNKPALFC